MGLRRGLWNYRSIALIVLAPLLLLPLPLEAECAFVLLLMATYWMTEVIPLPMTAMLPAILFPAFGIIKSSHVAKEYFKDFHFLLVGVICLATSIEKWGLHRRIALRLVTMVGVNPAWLMLGFMSGCAFISMWVQNTSAVAMVMPIVEAVLQQILKAKEEGCVGEDNPGLQLDGTWTYILFCFFTQRNVFIDTLSEIISTQNNKKEHPNTTVSLSRCKRDLMMCKAMCLGIAYSSNIGGISTLPGTSPNLIFSEYLNQVYPNCNCINFANWLVLCLPISVIMLLLTWIWLYWLFFGEQSQKEAAARKVIEEEYRSLGPMSSQEIVTAVVFVTMVLLWLTRAPGFMPGWASLFPHHMGYITDATVALLLGLLLFIIPAYGPSRKYGEYTHNQDIFFSISLHPEAMISWDNFQALMPWKVALLVGGGFALAEGTKESGLSLWVAELLTPLGDLPVLATIAIACIIVTTVTEFASNAATITIFLPILSPLAEAIHVNPLYVLIPTTLCTSYSFLLPVSNPPNAIVFGYGHITIMDMVKAGLGVNVIGVLATLLAVTTWGVPLFSLDTYPDWAPLLPEFNSTAP
uniref:Solute carrier family 13 member 1 n=1 Tax=Sander lucioperca TaxID=283035 RepID=A0A8D0AMT0_SANLU